MTMRAFGLMMIAQLLAILLPLGPLLILTTIAGLPALWLLIRQRAPLRVLLTLALIATPLWLWHLLQQDRPAPESLPSAVSLNEFTNFELAPEVRTALVDMLDSQDAQQLDILGSTPYVSATLLNLNRTPTAWQGHFFSDRYDQLDQTGVHFVQRDGRLFAQRSIPLPDAERPRAHLILETMLWTRHVGERTRSWLVIQQPDMVAHQPVIATVDSAVLLQNLAAELNADPPPFDVHFVPENRRHVVTDILVAFWALAFLIGLFVIQQGVVNAWLHWVGFLILLALPLPKPQDALTSFASYIFGDATLAGLLTTPLHLLLTVFLLFLLGREGLRKLRPRLRDTRWEAPVGVLLALGLGALAIEAPDFLQAANVFSYIHPLEAIASPGAFLSYAGFLAVPACIALLLGDVAPVPNRVLLPIAAGLAIATALFAEPYLIGVISFGLLWFLIQQRGSFLLHAALITTLFYPYLVHKERREEIDIVRFQLLDEITLQVERNHFRMGRIIQRLPELEAELARSTHDQLMEVFAKQAGLFEDEIDFALRLTDVEGRIISTVDQHIALDAVPYLLGPENRITQYQVHSDSETDQPNLLIFRRILSVNGRNYDFVAVLGNDYQNLSLVRQLRRVDQERVYRGGEGPSPYFAYLLDVYDLDGHALYHQRGAVPLQPEERRRLDESPYFWKSDGRNTLFFIKNRDYIHRITHKATPLRMVFARGLALFLSIVVIMQLVRLALRPGRGPLERWRRSFALKLAGFMFLFSVLPTSTLGYFLIRSIQSNQNREEAALATSKIQAARNLFRDLGRQAADAPRGLDPANLPIPEYARILGDDLSLYAQGALVKTTQPEAFRQGVLNRRLPTDLVNRLIRDREAYALQRIPLSGGDTLMTAYSPIQLGPNREAILSMTMLPYTQRQKFRWFEQLEFSVTILFGLLFVMALLTRFFARSVLAPVSAITRGASRMAKGVAQQPIRIHRQDELQRMVVAFNTMQETIQASQTRIRQQLDLLDETLKSMSGGLAGLSQDGRILLENQKLWDLLESEEPHPRTLAELIEREAGLIPLGQAFEQGRDDAFSFRKGEVELIAKLRLTPPATRHEVAWILAVEDITDAVAASRFKAWSEMARRVAHEIKNPLTPIQLEIDHLTRLYADRRPDFGDALDEAATEIVKQVQNLRRIATEFSDYARPIALEPNEINLADLLRDIIEPYRKTLHDMHFVIDLVDMHLAVDDRLLRRSFHNLITNAFQAMEQMGELRLRLFEDGDWAVIHIEDTGPGVPAEERSRIFEAYFSTKDQGTGLGMVIAKRYIDQHGGSLAIDPDYTDGARFVIRLPRPV